MFAGRKNNGRKHNNDSDIINNNKPIKCNEAKTEKIDLPEDEKDVLVSLRSKEEVLFNCKHADYHKKDARNRAKISESRAIFVSCR